MSLQFSREVMRLLDRCHFDERRFRAQQRQLDRSAFAPALAYIQGHLSPVCEERFACLPEPGSARHDELTRLGEAAIRAGKVAALLLNGGMATRFGGVAKGAARAMGHESFLALRIKQVRRVAESLRARVPVVLMSSFATSAATAEHLAAHGDFGFESGDLLSFEQGVSIRLTEVGQVFLGRDGAPSLYTPGHGDLPWALAISGVARKLRQRGVEVLFISNVDNVGCSFDPACIGAHVEAAVPMTGEIVRRLPGDVGGAPFDVDGVTQLVEGFRLPPSFNTQSVTAFNTNTFYMGWPALDPEQCLGFYPVAKKVDGATAVQFERIVGEVSKSVPCQFLMVPRDDVRGRFMPVKTPEDLLSIQPFLSRRYAA